jgi:flagellar protein FliO/FliZ
MQDFTATLQALLALVLVLCLIGLCTLAARRFLPALQQRLPGQPRRLRVVESLALDPRHRAIVLRCDGQEHLLVVGEGGISLLPPPLAVPHTAPAGEKII